MGWGARTGRTAGYCAGFGVPGYMNPVTGYGFGWGYFGRRGGGRGWRNMFYATGLPGWMRFGRYAPPYYYSTPYRQPDPEMEKEALKNQAQMMRSELDFIERRLEEIESPTKEEQS